MWYGGTRESNDKHNDRSVRRLILDTVRFHLFMNQSIINTHAINSYWISDQVMLTFNDREGI